MFDMGPDVVLKGSANAERVPICRAQRIIGDQNLIYFSFHSDLFIRFPETIQEIASLF